MQLTGRNNLSPAEVVVNGYRKNLALNKKTTQSSTEFGGAPSRAVDGDTNGDYGHGSVTHTSNEAQAWWMVDLGNTVQLDKIVIFNRTDTAKERLSNYTVSLLDENKQVVWSSIQKGYPDPSISIPPNEKGRYVKVQLNGKNHLSLAEVQVYGQ